MKSRFSIQYDRILKQHDIMLDGVSVGCVFKHPKKKHWYSKIGTGTSGTILPDSETSKHKAILRVKGNL